MWESCQCSVDKKYYYRVNFNRWTNMLWHSFSSNLICLIYYRKKKVTWIFFRWSHVYIVSMCMRETEIKFMWLKHFQYCFSDFHIHFFLRKRPGYILNNYSYTYIWILYSTCTNSQMHIFIRTTNKIHSLLSCIDIYQTCI